MPGSDGASLRMTRADSRTSSASKASSASGTVTRLGFSMAMGGVHQVFCWASVTSKLAHSSRPGWPPRRMSKCQSDDSVMVTPFTPAVSSHRLYSGSSPCAFASGRSFSGYHSTMPR